jgi:hypothetical protein
MSLKILAEYNWQSINPFAAWSNFHICKYIIHWIQHYPLISFVTQLRLLTRNPFHSQMASNYITCTKETMYLTIACNLWRPSQVLQPSNHTWFFRVVIAVTDSLPPSFSLFPFLNINFERGYLTKAITCNPLPIGWAPKYIPKNLDIECNSKNTNSKGDGLTVGYTITWSMFHI